MMKFWLFLSDEHPETLRNHARKAEEYGFEGIAMADHIAIPAGDRTEHPDKFPVVPDQRYNDQLISFASMAAVTTRLKFLSYVYVLPLRSPFLTAKQFGSAAIVSDDRVILGVGVGWLEEEFKLLEQPFGARGKRADEMLEIVRDFWEDGYAEFHGEFYDFTRTGMFPVPNKPLPIWIGGQARATAERAARYDGFMPMRPIMQMDRVDDDMRQDYERIKHLRTERGATGPYTFIVPLHRSFETYDLDALRNLAEVDGVTDLVVWPWADPELSFAEKWKAGAGFAESVIRRF